MVAPLIAVPVVLLLLAFVYHWYVKLGVPPAAVTLIASVPPIHSVTADGCVAMLGTGFTVTVAVELYTDEHTPLVITAL